MAIIVVLLDSRKLQKWLQNFVACTFVFCMSSNHPAASFKEDQIQQIRELEAEIDSRLSKIAQVRTALVTEIKQAQVCLSCVCIVIK